MPFPKTYRTNLWWAVIVTAALALAAGIGALTRPAIVALLLTGGTGAFLVAWEHQWLRGWKLKLLVIPLILLTMGGFFKLVWPPNGISITPESVTYDSVDTNFIFISKNNEDTTLYTVEFKFKGDSPSLSSKDFQIQIPSSSLKPIIEGSPASDICGLFLHDHENRPVLLVQFFRMTPHETREISWTHIKPGRVKLDALPSVFSSKTQPRIGNPLQRSCTFTADEQLTVDGTFFVMMNGNVIFP